MNACRSSLVFMPLRSHSECPLKALFNECLQEFIGVYALEVSFRLSFKGPFLMNACRKSLVFMPLRSHFECPLKAFFNACLQGFIGFYALQVSRLMSFKAFLMNACRISLVFMPLRSHYQCPLMAFFNECLQDFIGVYALEVSFRMSFKCLFNECLQDFISFYALEVSFRMSFKGLFWWMPAGFHWCSCPWGLIMNVL